MLMDNGNLRAIWRDGQGTHLGLQFLGGGMVQYVIFKKRAKEQSLSRATGRDSLEGLERSSMPSSCTRCSTNETGQSALRATTSSRYVKPSMVREDGTADGSDFRLRPARPDESGSGP